MPITTLNYIESISNPNSRFKTLHGLYAVTYIYGEPKMYVCNDFIRFHVVWNKTEYWLQCFTKNGAKAEACARLIATRTEQNTSPYLTRYMFLSQELTVFTDHGVPQYRDVILHEIPKGEKLHDFISHCCNSNDSVSLQKLLKESASMANWLYNNSFAHCNIQPSNIIVTPTGVPVLINYESARSVRSNDDNSALATLVILLFISACDQTLYKKFRKDSDFVISNIREYAERILENVDQQTEPKQFIELARSLVENNGLLHDRPALNTTLNELACCKIEPYPFLNSIFMTQSNSNEHQMMVDFSRYDCAKTISDNMILVKDNGTWKFMDKKGQPVIDAVYKVAYDFEEGRAVVETSEGFGLIDHEGNFVIPPIFEDMNWDCENGVIRAMKEGYFRLYDRNGKQTTKVDYERIDECGDDLIVAMNCDGDYGFLNRDGSVAIDFIYEDAYGFKNGVATVTLNGRELLIDTQGKTVRNKNIAFM